MTSLTDNPTFTQFLLFKASQAKRKDKRASVAIPRTFAWVHSLVRVLLTLGGFGFLTWGMFTWHIVAGLITAGISCFVLSWLTKPDVPQMDNGIPQAHEDRYGYTSYPK